MRVLREYLVPEPLPASLVHMLKRGTSKRGGK